MRPAARKGRQRSEYEKKEHAGDDPADMGCTGTAGHKSILAVQEIGWFVCDDAAPDGGRMIEPATVFAKN
jgi:hypothetical protein